MNTDEKAVDYSARPHSTLTGSIIASAQKVYRVLGSGFLEKVYRNSLRLELEAIGLEVQIEAPIEVRYRGEIVGFFSADLLVNNLIIVEIKAVEQLIQAHEVQLVNYLRATRVEVGLLMNFGPKFEVKRRIFTNDRKP